MADKRIKDLTTSTPAGTEFLPFDSSGGGTANSTITNTVDVGNQTISNPIIGVNTVTNLTTVRTQLAVSGNAVLNKDLRVVATASFGRSTTPTPTDAGVFISGTQNQFTPGQRYFIVSADTIMSGNILFKSSSINPYNALFGGNLDSALVFSGSTILMGAQAGVAIGAIGVGVGPIQQRDANFFVSGGIGGKGVGIRSVSVFGGDVIVSGNLYAGGGTGVQSFWQSRVSGTIYQTGSIEFITGSDGSGSPYAYLAGMTVQNGSTLVDGEHSLIISASSTVVSGWGGPLYLKGGHGGNDPNGNGYGGTLYFQGGNAGDVIFPALGSSQGGDLQGQAGAGGNSDYTSSAGGSGGSISLYGGSGGSATPLVGNAGGGNAGSVQIGGGNAGFSQNTGSGGTGGSVSIVGGAGGGSYAGYGGDGGSITIGGGSAGVGSSAKSFHSGNTIANGGTLTLQAGSPSAGYTDFTSGAGGNLFIYGGRVFQRNTYVSGSRLQIGSSGSDGSGATTYGFSRVFINAPVLTGSGFPGTDIFLYVSGTTNGRGLISGSIAVFAGDVHISGNLTTDGSNNPLCKVVSSSTYVVSSSDFGNAVAMTMSGSITASFTSNLTASFPSGRFAVVVIQVEATGALGLISMSGGATMNGVSTPVTLPTGSGVYSFTSRNGLNWYR